jgi:hypothetical protein
MGTKKFYREIGRREKRFLRMAVTQETLSGLP